MLLWQFYDCANSNSALLALAQEPRANGRPGASGQISLIGGVSTPLRAHRMARTRRGGGLPTELFAHARSNLLGAIGREHFDVTDAGLAEGFLLDGISGCRRTLEVPTALVFDSHHRPAALIDNEDVDSLAVDRAKRILVLRGENFSKADLGEDVMTPPRCRYVLFDDFEDSIFRVVKQYAPSE